MKIINSTDAQVFNNPDLSLQSAEYPVNDAELDCALVKISGAYPGDNKFAINTKSKELLFCVDGQGSVETKSGFKYNFKKHDVLLIERNEAYRFVANCSFIAVCTPPWSEKQSIKID